jgi:hypothetical protein
MKSKKKARKEIKKFSDRCDNKIRSLKKMIQMRKKAFMYWKYKFKKFKIPSVRKVKIANNDKTC